MNGRDLPGVSIGTGQTPDVRVLDELARLVISSRSVAVPGRGRRAVEDGERGS